MILAGNFIGVARSVPATNINGKWSGQIPSPNGASLEVTFEFKAQGGKLNGAVYAMGKEFPLVQGKMKDDTIFFKIEGDTPEYTGQVSGDVIQMKQTWRGGENGTRVYSFTLKRVAK